MMNPPSHIAYSDEAYTTASRYCSIAAVTLEKARDCATSQSIRELLEASGVKEFKWAKLHQARDRFAALKMIDKTLELAIQGCLRVDVLIWDTQDSRHSIKGRDDVANLQRMYYHLFRNVLQRRWPSESTWQLCPDENTALDWMTMQDFLDSAGLTIRLEGNMLNEGGFRLRLARDFSILEICEVCSSDTPICQLADLFGGLGVYSHSAYETYVSWLRNRTGQLAFDFGLGSSAVKLSNRDRQRCEVMQHLSQSCKRSKLRVGLRSSRGLKTHDPRFPINFWLYEPQHPDDKAPTREGTM